MTLRKILAYSGIVSICLLVGCKKPGTSIGNKNPKPGSVAYLKKKRNEIKTPKQAQDLIDTLQYDQEDANINLDTGAVRHYEIDSPKVTLKEGKAHCLEGALLAAYLLEDDGYDDEILAMYFSKIRFGHAIYIFQDNGLWGAVGQSRAEYLKGREPKYKTIRELVKSYNEALNDSSLEKCGKFTKFSVINVSEKYPKDWATRDKPL